MMSLKYEQERRPPCIYPSHAGVSGSGGPAETAQGRGADEDSCALLSLTASVWHMPASIAEVGTAQPSHQLSLHMTRDKSSNSSSMGQGGVNKSSLG